MGGGGVRGRAVLVVDCGADVPRQSFAEPPTSDDSSVLVVVGFSDGERWLR
jgi:hypothetical protein